MPTDENPTTPANTSEGGTPEGTTPVTEQTPPAEKSEKDKADEALAEAGKKALDAEREANKTLKAEIATLRESSVTKEEHTALAAERDKLTERVAELEKGIATRDLDDNLRAAFTEKGVANVKLAMRVVEKDQYDSEKNNLEDLVNAALADFPELVPSTVEGTPEVKDGLGNQGGPEGSKTPAGTKYFTKAQVEAMDEKTWEENMDAIFESQKRWK